MGQDVRLILGHSLSQTAIFELPVTLNAQTPRLRNQFLDARLSDIPQMPVNWQWERRAQDEPSFGDWLGNQWAQGDVVELRGPGSLTLDIGARSVIVGCWVRWAEFLSVAETREALRIIAFALSRVVGSTSAIYVPDSGPWVPAAHALDAVFEGRGFDEIKQQLFADAGPPARSIPDIYQRVNATIGGRRYDCFRGDGYYLDEFADFGEYSKTE